MIGALLACLFFLAGGSAAFAQDDDYLSAIEAEAESLDSGAAAAAPESTSPAPATSRSAVIGGGAEKLPEGLDFEHFEEILRAKYLGSYMFYSKLSDAGRRAAFDAYRESNDVSRLRRSIIRLFTKRR